VFCFQGNEMAGSIEHDKLLIEWGAGILMNDGLLARAGVFRPNMEWKWPSLQTCGPYAKGLAYQKGYPSA
jgi:uncharacterized protein